MKAPDHLSAMVFSISIAWSWRSPRNPIAAIPVPPRWEHLHRIKNAKPAGPFLREKLNGGVSLMNRPQTI